MAHSRCMIAALVCGAPFLIAARVEAQSFDCKNASTTIEKAICSDRAVSNLDQQLADAIQERLRQHPDWQRRLIMAERHWLRYRDSQCKRFADASGKMDDCLSEQYLSRLAVIRSPQPLAGDTERAPTPDPDAICHTLIDRYRPLANAHLGESPAQVLAESSRAGLVLENPQRLSTISTVQDLVQWASRQKPRIEVPDELQRPVSYYFGEPSSIRKAIGVNFYALSRTGGSRGCDESMFFFVKKGVASQVESPPNTGPDRMTSCGREGSFATLDGEPLYLQEDYDSAPDLSATIDVSTWRVDHFAGTCRVRWSYAPQFASRQQADNTAECNGVDCADLRSEASNLAQSAHDDAPALLRRYEQRLTPAQRAHYSAAQAAVLKRGDQWWDASAFSAGRSDNILDTSPLRLPLIAGGHFYLASLGHLTTDIPVLGDWSVKFEAIQGIQLVDKASFIVGMSKGNLLDASVSSIPNDCESVLGGCR